MIHIEINLTGGEVFLKSCNSLSAAFLSKEAAEAVIDDIAGVADEHFVQQGLFLDNVPWKPINEAYKEWKIKNNYSPKIGQRTGDLRSKFERGNDGKAAVFGYTIEYAPEFDAIRPIFGTSERYIQAYKEALIYFLQQKAAVK